jgi:hypothetical protein
MLAVVAGEFGCRRASTGGGGGAADLVAVGATVKRSPIDSESFLLVADSTGAQYVPDPALSEAYRVDGLRVVFSARTLEIPANVRMVGAPVRIIEIRRREGGQQSSLGPSRRAHPSVRRGVT